MQTNDNFTASPLLSALREQKEMGLKGGIYHQTQIDLTYNSNHMEGSRLSHEQTRLIFETNTLGIAHEAVNVDDILETVNHFRCVDLIIDEAHKPLTTAFVRQLHGLLKAGTRDSRRHWFAVGEYKRLPNEMGGREMCPPEQVSQCMEELLADYRAEQVYTLAHILDFHVRLERIHPFQDGNGRVGRLVMFKECLRSGIVPFIITDEMKAFYYRGLSEWGRVDGYLTDTCLSAQDHYKAMLQYFRIAY